MKKIEHKNNEIQQNQVNIKVEKSSKPKSKNNKKSEKLVIAKGYWVKSRD